MCFGDAFTEFVREGSNIMVRQAFAMSLVLASGFATAGTTIDLNYTGIVGGSDATRARIDSRTYLAGHMTHVITSGSNAGQSFNTFCIEVGEYATNGSATYEIIDLADAPNPGSYYGQERADDVNAIVANAVAMGWIDNRLQAVSSDADLNLERMGAIQAAIWEALGHNFRENHNRTDDGLAARYAELLNESSFDADLRLNGLRAVVAEGQQDMLYVVPLPPAAFAGMGLLGGMVVARRLRQR
jgi:hypothetical protein